MGGDDDWFEDYDTDMSDASGQANSQDSQCASDSRSGSGHNSSEDDDGIDEGFPASGQAGSGGPTDNRKRMYTVIDRQSLQKLQDEAISQVQAILGCTTTTARALLTHFSWDAETVLGTIAERGQEEVYRRAGLLSRTEEASASGRGEAAAEAAAAAEGAGGSSGAAGEVWCRVCMCDVPQQGATTMDCGHAFCDDCWREHMRINISEGMGRHLRCMADGCGVVCDEGKVKHLLKANKSLLAKYEQTLLESYVDDNKRVKWCPSVPHCGHAIRSQETHCEVDCRCGQSFCFACCEVQHSPATCDMHRDWAQRLKDGSETSSWLKANTKACPKCTKPVEKNGGCNLLLCRCGQAFCWLCGQATGRSHTWTNIEGHSCGAYKEEAEAAANEAQRNLKRYLHYLTRYEANLHATTLEPQLRKHCEERIDALLEADPTSMTNFSWLGDALTQLFLARKCMAYSHIFAFYMFGQTMFKEDFTPQANAINQALFEDKQGQLEAEVERLSQLIETKWQWTDCSEELSQQRMSIINLAAIIDMRVRKMYEVIECDIAPQVASRGVGIAPYKGKHATGSGGEAAAEVYRQAAVLQQQGLAAGAGGADGAAAAEGGGGSGAAAAGTSGSARPSSEVVDLTAATSDDGRTGRGKGKAPAAAAAAAARSKRKAGG